MREYGVSHFDVEQTLRHYDTCVPARRGCSNFFKRYEGYMLRITVYPVRGDLVIVTVWKETA